MDAQAFTASVNERKNKSFGFGQCNNKKLVGKFDVSFTTIRRFERPQ